MKTNTTTKLLQSPLLGQTVRIASKGTILHKKVMAEVWEGAERQYKVYVVETQSTIRVNAAIWDRIFLKSIDIKPDFKAKESYVTGNQIANPFRNK